MNIIINYYNSVIINYRVREKYTVLLNTKCWETV